MMSGNPNWWSINSMYPQSHQLSSSPFVIGASSNPSSVDHHHHNPNQDFPIRSWSQLLLGGHGGAGEGEEEEEKFESSTLYQLDKKLNHWDDNPQHRQEQTLNLDAKQEQSNYSHHAADDQYNNDRDLLTHHHHHHHHHHQVNVNRSSSSSSSSSSSTYCWPINTHHHHHQQVVMPPLVSSPTSCITSLSNNSSILNFSAGVQNNKPAALSSGQGKSSNLPHNQDHECNNSSSSGGVAKKARVQQSSAQPALKVRKEKLGDRITALHQLVSPFGKTDTASVLSEAIGYIGFLQGQIEQALSSPYIRKGSGRTSHHQQHSVNKQVQGRNNVFHEAHSQVNSSVHDDGLVKDLRSRGLCLVPISCTQNMTTATDNGADYWAQPPLGGGF